LVKIATGESNEAIVPVSEPSLLTAGLPEDDAGLLHLTSDDVAPLRDYADAMACGPGLGQSARLQRGLLDHIIPFDGPLVLDADGLNNLAALDPKTWSSERRGPTVITPHPGEMSRLLKGAGLEQAGGDYDESRCATAHAYAQRTGVIVVLKGHRTVVCDTERAYFNTTGNAGMATGGMGDVLTGLVVALLAQSLAPFDAACLAVWAHGAAADLLRQQIGPVGYLPREVADAVPQVIARPQVTGFNRNG
jgi:NAD(P)H-hydrate epimerase